MSCAWWLEGGRLRVGVGGGRAAHHHVRQGDGEELGLVGLPLRAARGLLHEAGEVEEDGVRALVSLIVAMVEEDFEDAREAAQVDAKWIRVVGLLPGAAHGARTRAQE